MRQDELAMLRDLATTVTDEGLTQVSRLKSLSKFSLHLSTRCLAVALLRVSGNTDCHISAS